MTANRPPTVTLYTQAAATFDLAVSQIRPNQWALGTPCPAWNVRDLVNHVVAEARWTPPLLAGLSPAEVGHSLEGDLLGQDPVTAWREACAAASRAAAAPDACNRTIQLSSGAVPGHEYLSQLTADYLVHAWDLSVATGADLRMDAALVEAVGGWFLPNEAAYRTAGAVGPRPAVEHDDDPQTRLLAMFGRQAVSPSLAAVRRFSAAFDSHDVDAVMAAMTADCVFEATTPPDGRRYEGQQQVQAAWADFFAESQESTFETEEQFDCGDHVVVRWRYTWSPDPSDHVRGVDVFRTRNGLVSEKLSYVTG